MWRDIALANRRRCCWPTPRIDARARSAAIARLMRGGAGTGAALGSAVRKRRRGETARGMRDAPRRRKRRPTTATRARCRHRHAAVPRSRRLEPAAPRMRAAGSRSCCAAARRASPTARCCSRRSRAGTTRSSACSTPTTSARMLEALRTLGVARSMRTARGRLPRSRHRAARFRRSSGVDAVPRQRRHRVSPAHRARWPLPAADYRGPACRGCTSGRSAISSMRCARSAADIRYLGRSAVPPLASDRALAGRRRVPARVRSARRRLEPVPLGAADGAAACADARGCHDHRRRRPRR